MPFATLVSTSPDPPAAAACLALVLVLVLAFVGWRARGTTLAAPLAWSVAAAGAIAAVEGLLSAHLEWEGGLGASIARYAAAVGACCPLVAVLGSKRPQDRGWQWIVLSLWAVLLVPAGQALLTHTGDHFFIPWAWRGVLALLIALGPLNYLPTRWGVASLLTAFGQYTLLTPWIQQDSAPAPKTLWALAIFHAAIILPALFWRVFSVTTAPTTPIESLTRRWLNFRNGWGAFWRLRILQRVNESAHLSHWPLRLTWHGFQWLDPAANAELDESTEAQIQQTLDTLLRRFERLPPLPSPNLASGH